MWPRPQGGHHTCVYGVGGTATDQEAKASRLLQSKNLKQAGCMAPTQFRARVSSAQMWEQTLYASWYFRSFQMYLKQELCVQGVRSHTRDRENSFQQEHRHTLQSRDRQCKQTLQTQSVCGFGGTLERSAFQITREPQGQHLQKPNHGGFK